MNHDPDPIANDFSRQVIGAAIEVHKALGPGYLESVYEEALAIEMTDRLIPFEKQYEFEIRYKDIIVGGGRIDFFVGKVLVIELKRAERIADVYRAQVLSYLKATGVDLGLILNFGAPILVKGIERIVLTK